MDRVATSSTLSETEAKFFTSNRSADATEKALVDFLKRRNDSSHFVEKTIERIGYPRWDKAVMVKRNNATENRTESGDNNAAVIYIPFARENENYVNAVMQVKTTSTDTSFSYLCDWQYRQTLSSPMADTSVNALKYFLFFAGHDQRVFGHSRFQLKDNRILQSVSDTLINTNKQYMLELAAPDENQVELMVAPNPELPHSSCLMIYDMISAGYVVDYYKVGKVCVMESYYLPGSTGGGGGGAGGNGGGNPPPDDTPPTCHEPSGPGMAGKPMDPCGPGWEPLPNDEPGSAYPVASVSSIIDSLINPCLINAKNRITDSTLRNFVTKLYYMNYNTTNVHIKFREDTTLKDSLGHPRMAESFPDFSNASWTVSINTNFFNGIYQDTISLEYTGMIILHEVVHSFVYLYRHKNGITMFNNFTTHKEMFNNWIFQMKEALLSSFPNLTNSDAMALALSGIDDVLKKEYIKGGMLSSYSMSMDSLSRANYGQSIPFADSISKKFQLALKGIKCQ